MVLWLSLRGSDMPGFTVTSITHGAEGVAEWTYNGSAKLTPKPLRWKPGAADAEDAANAVLATLLPIAVAAGESVKLPYAIAQSSLDFWKAKFAALQRFYVKPVHVHVYPIMDGAASDRTGDTVGLCYGGGLDSMAVLCDHIKRGIPLHLMFLRSPESITGSTVRCLQAAADAANTPLAFVDTNAVNLLAEYSRAIYRNVVSRDPLFLPMAPHRDKGGCSLLPYMFTRGFPFFFAALFGLPSGTRRILYSYECNYGPDMGEARANGFAFYNDVAYRGAALVPFTVGSKTDELELLRDFPHVAEHMKSCPSNVVQWCGDCIKCVRMHLLQRTLGMPPIPIYKGAELSRQDSPGIIGDMMAYYIRYRPNADQELESILARLLDKSAAWCGGMNYPLKGMR